MNQPIFLEPVFKDRIWGGTKLKELFGYEIPSDQTGECWAVSAHPNGQSVVKEGPYKGTSLGELWAGHPELFNSSSKVFPLLTKILDASDDLSVQVHPDDAYAGVHENGELGKTECWYIVDAEPGAEIIYGHGADSKEQLADWIHQGKWDQLLSKVEVKPGDFFYVPSGTLHALGKGIVVLETQQSSDTTYRVYDYDRKDSEGNTRELHLEKAIEVTTVPQAYVKTNYKVANQSGAAVTTFVENEFFTVQKWEVDGTADFKSSDKYLIISIIAGEGELSAEGHKHLLHKGDHLILPVGYGPYQLSGKFEAIASHE
ncbi:mannose-6-phosphate isomerase, class I [Paenibacillus tuaregi]|uniref:mannose-6-phosphate isomerase, class I n=1 Tax=Paenibacillus tuaregi TaxID=1816681 RepID=UPI000837E6F0|nr:mannose-6-phosphate isomerase, class I [Paenibacillus tuaregi]